MDYGKCATLTTNKIIAAEENGRKLIIKNISEKSVRKIKVDGCLITDSSKRCDYMFEIFETLPSKEVYHVIYLELKGRHLEEAYNQLITTIERFFDNHYGCTKECHIVASRVPKAGAQVQQLKVKMQKNKQAKLFVSTTQATVII